MTLHRNCEGTTRRDCLKLGLHTFVAGGLVGALRLQARAAEGMCAAMEEECPAALRSAAEFLNRRQ